MLRKVSSSSGSVTPHEEEMETSASELLCFNDKLMDSLPIEILPQALKHIVFDYMAPHKDNRAALEKLQFSESTHPEIKEKALSRLTKSVYQNTLNFFGNLQLYILKEAAHSVVMDKAAKAEKLIRENESIRRIAVRIEDEHGNKLKAKNLLWLAAITDNFNPRKPKEGESDYGIFEKISIYYTPKEVAEVAKAVMSPEWKAETARRMKPFVDAANTFMNSLVDNDTDGLSLEQLKTSYSSQIQEFRNKLRSNPNEVIESGYVFDLNVIEDALEKADENVDSVGGWDRYKIHLIYIVVRGSFSEIASACDARIIRFGLLQVVDEGLLPDRSEHFNKDNSYHVLNVGRRSYVLGRDFFWSNYGHPGISLPWPPRPRRAEYEVGVARTYVEQKRQRAASLCCDRASNRNGIA